MIAKTDMLIIAVAATLLTVAVAKSDPNALGASGHTMSRGAQPAGVDTRGRTNGQSGTSATVLASADTTEVVIIPGASSPSSGDVITSTASDFKAPDLIKEASFRTHVVERGDVLSKIAIRYQTTVAELQALNELNGTVIHVGQKLVYPSQQ